MRWATLPMPMKPGNGRSFEVNSDDATAPIAGNCTTGLGCLPVFISTVPRSWLPSLVTRERTSDRCGIWLAMVGSTSEISTPSALVLIGLNSPPFWLPGLRSHRSMWLGPPPIQRMMRLLFSFLSIGSAARRPLRNCMPGTARAEAPATCVRKCRRVIPFIMIPPCS